MVLRPAAPFHRLSFAIVFAGGPRNARARRLQQRREQRRVARMPMLGPEPVACWQSRRDRVVAEAV